MRKTYTQIANIPLAKKLQKDNFIQANEISRSMYTCSLTARKVIALASSLVEKQMRKLEWNEQNDEIMVWTAKFSISDFIKKFDISDAGQNYENVKKDENGIRYITDGRKTLEEILKISPVTMTKTLNNIQMIIFIKLRKHF